MSVLGFRGRHGSPGKLDVLKAVAPLCHFIKMITINRGIVYTWDVLFIELGSSRTHLR
jgi:hypothetical protein